MQYVLDGRNPSSNAHLLKILLGCVSIWLRDTAVLYCSLLGMERDLFSVAMPGKQDGVNSK
jgi:hypothetical protein